MCHYVGRPDGDLPLTEEALVTDPAALGSVCLWALQISLWSKR